MSESSLVKVEENNLVTVELSQRERRERHKQAQLAFLTEMRELGFYFAIVTLDPELETQQEAVIGTATNMALDSAARLLEAELENLQSGTPCDYQYIPGPSELVA